MQSIYVDNGHSYLAFKIINAPFKIGALYYEYYQWYQNIYC
jgi:hypothetical protein